MLKASPRSTFHYCTSYCESDLSCSNMEVCKSLVIKYIAGDVIANHREISETDKYICFVLDSTHASSRRQADL